MAGARRARRPDVRLDDRRRELAADFWPLALKLSAGARARHPWLDDEILSEAAIELVRLAGRLDRGRENVFAGLARTRVAGACGDVIRREYKRRMASIEGKRL